MLKKIKTQSALALSHGRKQCTPMWNLRRTLLHDHDQAPTIFFSENCIIVGLQRSWDDFGQLCSDRVKINY